MLTFRNAHVNITKLTRKSGFADQVIELAGILATELREAKESKDDFQKCQKLLKKMLDKKKTLMII